MCVVWCVVCGVWCVVCGVLCVVCCGLWGEDAERRKERGDGEVRGGGREEGEEGGWVEGGERRRGRGRWRRRECVSGWVRGGGGSDAVLMTCVYPYATAMYSRRPRHPEPSTTNNCWPSRALSCTRRPAGRSAKNAVKLRRKCPPQTFNTLSMNCSEDLTKVRRDVDNHKTVKLPPFSALSHQGITAYCPSDLGPAGKQREHSANCIIPATPAMNMPLL